MERFIGFVERRSRWILLVTLVLSALAALRVTQIRYTDDITGFMPDGDPEVTRFFQIGEMFGGLNIAIVGLEVERLEGAPADSDLFTAPRLRALQALTKRVAAVDGVSAVSSLATTVDIHVRTVDGELQTDVVDVIPRVLPEDAAELAKLRERVLAAAHLVGAFVSADGQAALVLAQLDPQASALETARAIRGAALAEPLATAGLRLHLGGAPFINEGLARASSDDILLLGPLVGLAIVLIIFLSFRSFAAIVLCILPMSMAILLTLGLMAALDSPLTLVSSALPVLLLAIGATFPVNVISRSLAAAHERGSYGREAVREGLRRVVVPIAGAAGATICGFGSFVIMDISAMRLFGAFMSAGTAIAAAVALIVVPAALFQIRLRPEAVAPPAKSRLTRALLRAVATLDARPILTGLLVVAIAAGATVGVLQIRSEMSAASYYTRETDVVRADRFLSERFGGSLFLQLLVEGDIRDPLVLDEIARLEDHTAAIPGVSNVRSVTEVLRMANRGLMGGDAVPRRADQVTPLAAIAGADPAVRMLVTKDWRATLLQVRLGGFDTAETERILTAVRGFAAGDLARDMAAVPWRGAASAPALFERVVERATGDLESVLYPRQPASPERHARLAAGVASGLRGTGYLEQKGFRSALRSTLDENFGEDGYVALADAARDIPALVEEVLQAMGRGPLGEEEFRALVLARADAAERADELAARRRHETRTPFARAAAVVHRELRGLQDEAVRDRVIAALEGASTDSDAWRDPQRAARARHIALALTDDEAFVPTAVAKAVGAPPLRTAPLALTVSGYPVLWSGMNHSVQANQTRSSFLSVALIVLMLWAVFRSLSFAIAAMLPASLALLVGFGALGHSGVALDMGSSMVSSITLGTGLEYAIYLIWSHRKGLRQGRERAARHALVTTGRIILISAAELTVGFGLFLFGTIAPMAIFGLLTGACLLLAAGGTLLLLPLVLRRLPEPRAALAAAPAVVEEEIEDERVLFPERA